MTTWMRMNAAQENELEAAVGRELKSLGELPAPATLAARVMRRIEQRNAAPWYRRSWQTWPMSLQAAAVVILLAAFAGICLGFGGVTQTASATLEAQKHSAWFEQLGVVWSVLNALATAVVAMANHLGRGVIVAGVILILAAYAACAGMGTAYVRFALSRR